MSISIKTKQIIFKDIHNLIDTLVADEDPATARTNEQLKHLKDLKSELTLDSPIIDQSWQSLVEAVEEMVDVNINERIRLSS